MAFIFKRWMLKAVFGAVIALFVYHERQAIYSHFMIQRLKALSQTQQRPTQAPRPLPPLTLQQVEADRAAARKKQKNLRPVELAYQRTQQEPDSKDRAWKAFFQETQRCLLPGSQGAHEVCQAREARLRSQFEARWSRGE